MPQIYVRLFFQHESHFDVRCLKAMPLATLYIYSDASFSKPHGIAIIGFTVFRNEDDHDKGHLGVSEITLCKIEETNNIRAEIRGVIAALETCPMDKKVVLYTDCRNIVDLQSRREKLEDRNFMSLSKGQELANADLYRVFYALYDRIQPEIIWVKGHSVDLITNIQKNFSYLDKSVRKKLREYTA